MDRQLYAHYNCRQQVPRNPLCRCTYRPISISPSSDASEVENAAPHTEILELLHPSIRCELHTESSEKRTVLINTIPANPPSAPLSYHFTKAVFNDPPPPESDDCLYLNVFAPRKERRSDEKPYPVLYWLYGGSWQFGNAGQPWYDGSHFAGLEDVVVAVTVNYRTNSVHFSLLPMANPKYLRPQR